MESARRELEAEFWVEELRKEYPARKRLLTAAILISFTVALIVGLLAGLL